MRTLLPRLEELKLSSKDLAGGVAAGLVALPSATAFGLVVVAPLGHGAAQVGALLGMLGASTIGIVAALFGGAPRLVSAPCAPAAAMLAGSVAELVRTGADARALGLLALTGMLTGLLQLVLGVLRAGRFIKYIPYSVVAGYMSGVGAIIVLAQLPKLFGVATIGAIVSGAQWDSALLGALAIALMFLTPRLTDRVPPPILALLGCVIGVVGLRLLGDARAANSGPLVVGALRADAATWMTSVREPWSALASLSAADVRFVVAQSATLAVLLSIDTLKTCVVLDSLTSSRHDSNRELLAQGFANIASACAGGMPGAGTMGATLVNIGGGGRRRSSGLVAGAVSLVIVVLFPWLFAWLPTAGLAGILVAVGVRMIDTKTFALVKKRETAFDFAVVALVCVVAVSVDLLAAAGAGVAAAIVLFLREQMRTPIVRRRRSGAHTFSSTKRLPHEIALLEKHGDETLVLELQGDLFFGTSDQLNDELERAAAERKNVILGLRNVQSIDFSSVHTLHRIHERAKEQGRVLLLAEVPARLRTGQDIGRYLEEHGLKDGTAFRVFPTLDEALEWVEDRVLAAHGGARVVAKALPLGEVDCLRGAGAELVAALERLVVERELKKGELVFRAGDAGDTLLFVRRGAIRVQLALADGRTLRLATFGAGDVCGEMAFIDGGTRSADAIALEDASVYELSRAALDRAAAQAPDVAELVFLGLARTLSTRLRQADRELHALQDA